MNDKRTDKPLTIARLNILGLGSGLLAFFLVSVILLGIGLVALLIAKGIKEVFAEYWVWLLIITLLEIIIFWAGIIMVYVTSVQLGLKMRIIGLACGMIPVVHLIVLTMIIIITSREARFEKAKIKLDRQRASGFRRNLRRMVLLSTMESTSQLHLLRTVLRNWLPG